MIYLDINKEQKRSYSKQLYQQIRRGILSGELNYGDPLPSTRRLASDLQISRNTILTAYDMLIAEGFVSSSPRSGFRINQGTGYQTGPMPVTDLSTASLTDLSIPQAVINFDSGLPALDLFPRGKWNRVVSKAFLEAPDSALGYDNPQGRPELRAVLSRYLGRSRGISCHPDQIVITSGTKQSLTLIAKCLLNESSEVWIEDPTNINVRQIFSYHTNHIVPLPVDREGIILPAAAGKAPALIFITPDHQFPMGGILSIRRRIELAAYAIRTGCLIVEDDYDSEFRYTGPPVRSLCELADGHVIHAGTFSKTLFPSLRLGYLVLPPHLVAPVKELKRLSDHHTGSIQQLALTHFIETGELERHIKRMKREYQTRRSTMTGLLNRLFPDAVTIHGKEAGMHLVAEFKDICFTDALLAELLNRGVYVVPVQKHSAYAGGHQNQIILGFAQTDSRQMLQGLSILKELTAVT